MCIIPPLCTSGGKFWFLIPVEKTGAWLVLTENVGVSCFGYFFFRLLFKFLISVATICWSFALYIQGFRRIPHPHIPCFPALPFSLSPSGCLTSSLSLCTNLAAERKRTRENLILLILITSSLLGKCLFLVLSVFWALSSCLSEAGWARACFIYPEFEMVDKGTSSFSLSSPRVLEMLSGRKMMVTFDTALT